MQKRDRIAVYGWFVGNSEITVLLAFLPIPPKSGQALTVV
jgi:hypothetical protein